MRMQVLIMQLNLKKLKKLEAQLETLAKQGTDLGAKISKGNVTDSKTLDEIKSLLTEQVKTISDLATKQKAINDKFDADTKAWNDGQAEAQKLTDELTKTASELQKSGATVKTGQAESGKSWDEIKAGLQAQIAEAKKVKAAQDTTNANTSAADADYQAKLAQYTKDKAQYDKDKAEYDKKKTQYDKDKAAYDTAKAKYDKEKTAYDAAMAEARANTGKDGWLTEAQGQSLIYQSEPNAKTKKSQAVLLPSQNSREPVENTIGPSEHLEHPMIGSVITAEYTNLQNSYYNGKKISKVVYKYTIKEGTSAIKIAHDPTKTAWVFGTGGQYDDGDMDIPFEAQFYDEDGNLINFSSADGASALISVASLNSAGITGIEKFKLDESTAKPILISWFICYIPGRGSLFNSK